MTRDIVPNINVESFEHQYNPVSFPHNYKINACPCSLICFLLHYCQLPTKVYSTMSVYFWQRSCSSPSPFRMRDVRLIKATMVVEILHKLSISYPELEGLLLV